MFAPAYMGRKRWAKPLERSFYRLPGGSFRRKLNPSDFQPQAIDGCPPSLISDVFLQNSHKIVILSGAPHRLVA
jgi:hypothetical protein